MTSMADPTSLAALYDWLRLSSPTLGALPPSSSLRFRWRHTQSLFGMCRTHVDNVKRGSGPIATITLTARNSTPLALAETMAHEMCHVLQHSEEVMRRGVVRSASHGPKFWRMAEQVCKELHLNPHVF